MGASPENHQGRRSLSCHHLLRIIGRRAGCLCVMLLGLAPVQADDQPAPPTRLQTVAGILGTPARLPRPRPDRDLFCSLIEQESSAYALPSMFLARLIWKESHFRPSAVSPKGAQGIAQFMPATAARRGLADPFDTTQAILHSASYLKDLRDAFGNLGLAAAAYNAGEDRVSDWISGVRTLPWETRDYVSFITGHSAEDWKAGEASDADLSSQDPADFHTECMKLPIVILAETTATERDEHTSHASRFPPLVACVQGRLCSMRIRR
jgi:hypothetical protein